MQLQNLQELLENQERVLKTLLREARNIEPEGLNRVLKGHSRRFNEIVQKELAILKPNFIDIDEQPSRAGSGIITKHGTKTPTTAPSNSMTTSNVTPNCLTTPRSATHCVTPRKPFRGSRTPRGEPSIFIPATPTRPPGARRRADPIAVARTGASIMEAAMRRPKAPICLYPNNTPLKRPAEEESQIENNTKKAVPEQRIPLGRHFLTSSDAEALLDEAANQMTRNPNFNMW